MDSAITIYWMSLWLVTLIPIPILTRRFRPAYVPLLIYATAVWLFLVAGLTPYIHQVYAWCGFKPKGVTLSYSGRYYFTILIAAAPTYIALVAMWAGRVASPGQAPRRVMTGSGWTGRGEVSTAAGTYKPAFSVCMPLGAEVCSLPRRDVCRWLYGQAQVDYRLGVFTFYATWSIALVGMVAYIFYNGPPPLADAIGLGTSRDIYRLRMDVTYGETYRTFKDFFILWPAFSAILGHCLFRLGRIRAVTNTASILFAIAISFAFLHKSHMALIVLQLFLVEVCLGRASLRKMLLVSATIGSMFVATYFFYHRSRFPLGWIVCAVMRRIVSTYNVSLDFVLAWFPSQCDYLMGRTFPNPKGIFGFESLYLSQYVMEHLRGKTEGAIPVPAVGEWYVNFGVLGMLGGMLMITGWIAGLSSGFGWCRRHVVSLVVWIMIVTPIVRFSCQSFWAVIDVRQVLILFVVMTLVRLYRNRQKASWVMVPAFKVR